MPRHSQDPLENFVHRALRDLPDRRAPADLQQRVLAAIAARSALPWWRRGWVAWPTPARVAALVAGGTAAAGVAVATFLGWRALGTVDLGAFAADRLPQAAALGRAGLSIGESLRLVFDQFAQPYLLGLLVVLGAGYAACVGLGASIYRSFVLHR